VGTGGIKVRLFCKERHAPKWIASPEKVRFGAVFEVDREVWELMPESVRADGWAKYEAFAEWALRMRQATNG
jgi:hypothetical protein